MTELYCLECALTQNYLKLIQSASLMNELFTFSSQQFQMIVPSLPASICIRKKIISNIGIRRQSSLQPDSTTTQLCQVKGTRKSALKKVAFDLDPLPEPRKLQLQVEKNLEENLKKLDKTVQSGIKRYFVEIENKKSLELERRSCPDRKILQQKEGSSIQPDHCIRNERRMKSFRLAPKVLFPLSDRKLPKVFKMMSNENYLPPLLSQKQASKRLAQSGEIRETFSSQRARLLLNYGQQLAKINKRQFIEDENERTLGEK